MLMIPSDTGYYGDFGGAFVPEVLHGAVQDLLKAYEAYAGDAAFNAELDSLLKDYVGRPTPLYLTRSLSARYNARIFLKREDLNHTGAHKINNALAQILLARRMGKTDILAETGAGQHGVATATACALMGMRCRVFMGATDIARQQPNVRRMQMLGATVIPVTSGNATLKDACNEAIRTWCTEPGAFYIIGSTVGPHPYPAMVARFQSVISREMRAQLLEQTGNPLPDAVVACVGGGSNSAGAFYHFIDEPGVRLVACEAAGLGTDTDKTAASIAVGTVGILHGSRTMLMQDDDGQITEPYSISAGLDYPGVGPMHSHLARTGRMEVLPVTDAQALEAAYDLTLHEGIIPALESAHALAALPRMGIRPGQTVVVNLSGRGDKDMETYINNMQQ